MQINIDCKQPMIELITAFHCLLWTCKEFTLIVLGGIQVQFSQGQLGRTKIVTYELLSTVPVSCANKEVGSFLGHFT